MSFILDALRKSETERQQQAGPSLADSQYRSPKAGRNVWIPLLIVVLAANAIVVAYVMNDESTDSENSVRVIQPATVPRAIGNAEIRPLAREVTDSQVAVFAEPVTTPNAGSIQPESVGRQFIAGDSNARRAPEAGTVQEGLPNLQQLISAGEVSVQPMHLDIHVYSDTRTERFVFINMKKYKEGETLNEGPSVDEITSTGAILSYRGKRFTLDRD
jgi:general secretion pathway protein B